jgi:hypothetical protein
MYPVYSKSLLTSPVIFLLDSNENSKGSESCRDLGVVGLNELRHLSSSDLLKRYLDHHKEKLYSIMRNLWLMRN